MNHDVYFAGVLINMDNAIAAFMNTEGDYGVLVVHDTSGNEHKFDTGFLAEEAARLWREGFRPTQPTQAIPPHTH